MKRLTIAALPLLGLIFLASCRKNPGNHLTVEESWVYISSGNSDNINYANFQTITIPDSVVLISNRQGTDNFETNALAQSMIAEVKSALQARGYTITAKNNAPDLGISIARVDNSYTNVAAYNGWWDPTMVIGILLSGAIRVMDGHLLNLYFITPQNLHGQLILLT